MPKRHRPDADRLRVVALLHKYPPVHNAGAEWMAHSLFREMVARGHAVDVYVPDAAAMVLDGVGVWPWRGPGEWAGVDVVVTHLDRTRDAVNAARQVGAPVVHLVHNDRQLQRHGVQPRDADLVVVNSHWIAATYRGWAGRLEVVHPPVDVDAYTVTAHVEDRVTLVNLWEYKGGRLFWDLARELPHRQFLGVRGAYAPQEADRGLPNVEVIGNTPHIRDDVYARTKVLLMPSGYESWGRCAVEAACSGIPTVAAPTPGLVEALGSAGYWAKLDDPDLWCDTIEMLFDDPDEYERASARAWTRARELDPNLGDYDRFEALMVGVARGEIRA